MICKLMNKLEKMIGFMFDFEYSCYRYEYNLKEVLNICVLFMICVLFISWWSIPYFHLFKKCNKLNIHWPIFRCDRNER